MARRFKEVMGEAILSQLEEEAGFAAPTRLTLIADWVFGRDPIDLKKFESDLLFKLKKFRFPPERLHEKKTFFERLHAENAVPLVLNTTVLTKLWKLPYASRNP